MHARPFFCRPPHKPEQTKVSHESTKARKNVQFLVATRTPMIHHRMITLLAAFAAASVGAQTPPPDAHRRLYSLGDVRLEGGAVLPNATLAYATFGTLNAQRSNAVLLPSWYGSDHHGYDFLIGPGRALDPARDYIVLTEMFANGWSSSPSNTPPPFNGPRFPAIAIRDNVSAVHRLLTSGLGVTHLRAIIGFSMGAQQAFQWAVSHPAFMDRIVAY
jgi:homoserine O-acetyltransferase